jgi:hypothetical protein
MHKKSCREHYFKAATNRYSQPQSSEERRTPIITCRIRVQIFSLVHCFTCPYPFRKE